MDTRIIIDMANERKLAIALALVLSVMAPLRLLAADDDEWSKTRAAGIAAERSNKLSEAEKQFKHAVELSMGLKNTDRRVTLSLEDLAGVYAMQKKYLDAKVVYSKILKIQESIHGKEDPELIPRLNDVIKVTCANGSCYNTLPELRRLLIIRKKAYGPNSSQMPMTLQLIGEAYEKHNDFNEALTYFRQAVSVQKKISGANSPMVNNLNKNIDRILSRQL